MRIVLFDVDHGFCAFVKTPTGHSILIDCGKGPNFSPTEYLLKYELNPQATNPLTKAVISHPHADHIEDWPAVQTRLRPAILYSVDFNWTLIKTQGGSLVGSGTLDAYVSGKGNYSIRGVADPYFGMSLQHFGLEPNRAHAISASLNSAVNNSSVVTVVTHQGAKYQTKCVFAGDMESEGFMELLKNSGFRQAIARTDFYFAAHHGHSSGFSTDLFEAMGKPFLNLISVRHNDESRDGRYSDDDFSAGWPVGGETRKMLSTTCDGSIFIDVDTDGQPFVYTRFLPDNLESPKPPTSPRLPRTLRSIGF